MTNARCAHSLLDRVSVPNLGAGPSHWPKASRMHELVVEALHITMEAKNVHDALQWARIAAELFGKAQVTAESCGGSESEEHQEVYDVYELAVPHIEDLIPRD